MQLYIILDVYLGVDPNNKVNCDLIIFDLYYYISKWCGTN